MDPIISGEQILTIIASNGTKFITKYLPSTSTSSSIPSGIISSTSLPLVSQSASSIYTTYSSTQFNNHTAFFIDSQNDISSISTSTFDVMFYIFTVLIYGTAFIFGTIGNSLIIYIVSYYTRMRTLCNVFLASLATADLLLVFVCIPVKLIQLLTYTWTLGIFTCKALHYIQNVSAFCSVLTLTTMSIERYYAIIHPVECRTTFSMAHIKKIITLVWILAFLMAIPTTFVYIQIPLTDPQLYWCVKISGEWLNQEENQERREHLKMLRKIFECYQMTTILVIPALVMIYMYARICFHLWSIMNDGGHEGVRYGRVKQRKNLKDKNRQKNDKFCVEITVVNDKKIGTTSFGSPSDSSLTIPSYRLSYQQKTLEEDQATVKQVIKMLVAVVVFFIICWGPLITMNLLRGFELISETNDGYLKEMFTVAYLMAYLNSVINPFVYGFMSKNFRCYFFEAINDILRNLAPNKYKKYFKSTKTSNTMTLHQLNGNIVRRSVPNTQNDNYFDLKYLPSTQNTTRHNSSSNEQKQNGSTTRLTDDDRALADELGLSVIVLESENDSFQLIPDNLSEIKAKYCSPFS